MLLKAAINQVCLVMRMKREEHYSVYKAILIAKAVEDRVNFFFLILAIFFGMRKNYSTFEI